MIGQNVTTTVQSENRLYSKWLVLGHLVASSALQVSSIKIAEGCSSCEEVCSPRIYSEVYILASALILVWVAAKRNSIAPCAWGLRYTRVLHHRPRTQI